MLQLAIEYKSQGKIIRAINIKQFFLKIDFDGYYIVRTDEGQPRSKYVFRC